MSNVHIDDFKGKRLHFVGIGGCSMSGLALICAARGYKVTGSDRNESPFTRKLEQDGISPTIGHAAQNVDGADLLIYSAAIKPDNPERARAKELNIPEIERSVLLGQLSSQFKEVVGIAGCHGKTTITSMLALISMQGELDPTVHVGGMVDFLEGGVRLGESGMFITEACEYVESYLTLRPTLVVINNIDDDHLDYFRDIDHIAQSYAKFVSLMPQDGVLIGCHDDERVLDLMSKCEFTKITYGLTGGDYIAKDIFVGENGNTRFTVEFRGTDLYEIELQIPGKHNIVNALAAIAVARHYNVDGQAITKALYNYSLTRRRFELYGEVDGVKIFHDYAHHPNEIRACLQGARSICKGKVWAVLQCNSYTRAKTLFCGNVTCFGDADEVLVPDIYPGREVDTGIVHARDMVDGINNGGTKAVYLKTFEDIRDYLRKNSNPGDIVVTLGSGDVYIQTKKLL